MGIWVARIVLIVLLSGPVLFGLALCGSAILFTLVENRVTEPHVSWSPDAGVPPVSVAAVLRTTIPIRFVSFSPDGSEILSVDAWGGKLTIRKFDGSVDQSTELPEPSAYHLMLNSHRTVMPGNIKTGVAFQVVDVSSGETLFWDKIPPNTAPGVPQMAVHFALSADASLLAVSYGGFLPGQPISFYDARHWHKLFEIEMPDAQDSGIGLMAFSRDGQRLAVSLRGRVEVLDIGSRSLVATIPVGAGAIDLNPDGSLLALIETEPGGIRAVPRMIRVMRVRDGFDIASHLAPRSGPNCPVEPDDCGPSGFIRWDSKGRFLVFPDGHGGLQLWNPLARSVEDVVIHIRSLGAVAFSPDGSRLALGDHNSLDLFRIGY